MSQMVVFLFSSFALVSSALVVTATNPVHSVFALIFVFVNVAGVLLVLRVEFLSLLFLVVYVGAVAVLFLFVIMMLNVKLNEISEFSVSYLPLGLFLGLIFILEISFIVSNDFFPLFGDFSQKETSSVSLFSDYVFCHQELSNFLFGPSNIQLLGFIIYTDLVFPFILAGLILFVAMIGAIVLSLLKVNSCLKQDIFSQVSHSTFDSIRLT